MRFPRSRALLLASGTIVLVAAIIPFAFRHRTPLAVPGVPDAPGVEFLAGVPAQRYIASGTPENARSIADLAAATLLDLVHQERLAIPEPARLAEVIAERSALLFGPEDYGAYLRHVADLTGVRDPAVVQRVTRMTPEIWVAQGSQFRNASVAPEALRVGTVTLRDANENFGLHRGGLTATKRDGGLYIPPSLASGDPPAILVEIPMRYTVRAGGEPRTPTVLLQHIFVWNAESRRWVPFSTGVADPGGAPGQVLLTPWI